MTDNNKISQELKTIYCFKIFRAALITISGSYFFGMISWIAFRIVYKSSDYEHDNFIQKY